MKRETYVFIAELFFFILSMGMTVTVFGMAGTAISIHYGEKGVIVWCAMIGVGILAYLISRGLEGVRR